MIIGIGTDIVNIGRIEKILAKYGEIFLKRILSKVEIEKLKSLPITKKVNFVAKRFAAKEAISKAIGTGINQGLTFKNIVIDNDRLGKPYAYITALHQNFNNNFKIHLSLSDEYPLALAFAVIST